MAEVLRAAGARFGVAAAVMREALWVLRGGDGDDAGERDSVDLEPLIAAGLLQALDLETAEELATFVDFAALVDDGEAATIALAIHRGGAVATDDRKAIGELGAHAPSSEIWTTARLLHAWAEAVGASPRHIAVVLRAVRLRSRFEPSRRDPLVDWSTSHQRGGDSEA